MATAPTGFEISTDGSSYGTTATYTNSSGSASGTVYVRLKADAQVNGSYNNLNISLTSAGATTVNVTTASTGNLVGQKSITVAALAQSKFEGTTSPTSGILNTHFSVTGLVNPDVVNSVTLGYSGAPSGNLVTAIAGSYDITPSALTFSTGSSSNYLISYQTGVLTINAPSSPSLNSVVLSSALTSSYGNTSNSVGFIASGSNLTSNITVTAQVGYEISINDMLFVTTVSVTDGTTVFVRYAFYLDRI